MNREILFRGKTVEPPNKRKWIYGTVIFPKEGLSACITDGNIATCRLEDTAYFVHTQVLLETVGQYTGLTDKNGKKIFEGDIVEFNLTAESIGYIVWMDEEAKFAVQYEENDLVDFDSIWGRELEVIGNIHDNPELLE